MNLKKKEPLWNTPRWECKLAQMERFFKNRKEEKSHVVLQFHYKVSAKEMKSVSQRDVSTTMVLYNIILNKPRNRSKSLPMNQWLMGAEDIHVEAYVLTCKLNVI